MGAAGFLELYGVYFFRYRFLKDFELDGNMECHKLEKG
jgi:hypothetical protein